MPASANEVLAMIRYRDKMSSVEKIIVREMSARPVIAAMVSGPNLKLFDIEEFLSPF